MAWLLQFRATPRFALWLHRLLPTYKATAQESVGIWLSQIDGTGMHELGHIYPGKEASQNLLDNLGWLPDGKHLSFIYKDALWTILVR